MKKQKTKKHHQRDTVFHYKEFKAKYEALEKKVLILEDKLVTLTPLIKQYEQLALAKYKIIISADASYTEVEGGSLASCAFVIRFPEDSLEGAYTTCELIPCKKDTNNNIAEVDAIYRAIMTFASLHCQKKTSGKKIHIHTDSQLAVKLLYNQASTNSQSLQRKINILREEIQALSLLTGKEIKLIWKKRNSTWDLENANNQAQSLINVKQH